MFESVDVRQTKKATDTGPSQNYTLTLKLVSLQLRELILINYHFMIKSLVIWIDAFKESYDKAEFLIGKINMTT